MLNGSVEDPDKVFTKALDHDLEKICTFYQLKELEVYGSHGFTAVAFLGKPENQNPELIEVLDGLDEYAVIDEDDESQLEMDLESAAWADDGQRAFAKALVFVLDEIDPEHEHDADALCEHDTLWEIWRDGCDLYNLFVDFLPSLYSLY